MFWNINATSSLVGELEIGVKEETRGVPPAGCQPENQTNRHGTVSVWIHKTSGRSQFLK